MKDAAAAQAALRTKHNGLRLFAQRAEFERRLAVWIRKGRKRMDISQDALGAALGVAQADISAWELERVVPGAYSHYKLRQVLGGRRTYESIEAFRAGFGGWLASERALLSLNLVDLAERMEVRRPVAVAWELGAMLPDAYQWYRLRWLFDALHHAAADAAKRRKQATH